MDDYQPGTIKKSDGTLAPPAKSINSIHKSNNSLKNPNNLDL